MTSPLHLAVTITRSLAIWKQSVSSASRKSTAPLHQRRRLAQDLQHYLVGEPIRAKRPGIGVRRQPDSTPPGVGLGDSRLAEPHLLRGDRGSHQHSPRRAEAQSANELRLAAEKQAAAEHRESETQRHEAQTQRREVLLQQMQRVRLTDQRQGWSTDAWDLARRAAADRARSRIQAEAAALLAGIDVRKVKSLPLPGTSLAFNRSGKHLMIGGSNPFRHETERPIRIWDSTTHQVQPMQVTGEGRLRFPCRRNPSAPQGPRERTVEAQLWDVAKAHPRTFQSPLEGKSTIRGFALTPDGTIGRGLRARLDEKGEPADSGRIAVWEATSGREIFRSSARA